MKGLQEQPEWIPTIFTFDLLGITLSMLWMRLVEIFWLPFVRYATTIRYRNRMVCRMGAGPLSTARQHTYPSRPSGENVTDIIFRIRPGVESELESESEPTRSPESESESESDRRYHGSATLPQVTSILTENKQFWIFWQENQTMFGTLLRFFFTATPWNRYSRTRGGGESSESPRTKAGPLTSRQE